MCCIYTNKSCFQRSCRDSSIDKRILQFYTYVSLKLSIRIRHGCVNNKLPIKLGMLSMKVYIHTRHTALDIPSYNTGHSGRTIITGVEIMSPLRSEGTYRGSPVVVALLDSARHSGVIG